MSRVQNDTERNLLEAEIDLAISKFKDYLLRSPVDTFTYTEEEFKTALLDIIRRAENKAKLEFLDDLLVTGHTAERASVPNTDESLVWDRASWVTIQAPIFYTFAATIERHKKQLKRLEGKDE